MKKEIIGIVKHDPNCDDWSFRTEESGIFSSDVVTAIDEILGEYICDGEKIKITIQKFN